MQRSRRSGSKRIAIEGENGPVVDGRLAPFTLVTTSDLMQTAYDCGLGTYNSYGLGMIGFAEGARTHA
ncbi:MAG: hypothetical protein EON58_23195 [Alphaproteobacteria bacterium]|nr:MAG: hypothetical protein EON58_23195 [Alphaproteobacteria bacterium]